MSDLRAGSVKHRPKWEVLNGEPLHTNDAANMAAAKQGSLELLRALHRYFLKHGDGRA